jgi:hypothetical protein
MQLKPQVIREGLTHWPWLLVIAGLVAAAVFAPPIGVPLLSLGLIVGGIVGYRQSSEPVARAVAAGAIAGGAALLLLVAVVAFVVFPVRSETTVSEPVPVTQPAP